MRLSSLQTSSVEKGVFLFSLITSAVAMTRFLEMIAVKMTISKNRSSVDGASAKKEAPADRGFELLVLYQRCCDAICALIKKCRRPVAS